MNVHFEECWDKTRYESDHVITLRGQEIPYHTVCEDNFFYDHEGKAVATIYSYAYFRSDIKDSISGAELAGYPYAGLYETPSGRQP